MTALTRRGLFGLFGAAAATAVTKPVIDLVEPVRSYFFIGDPVRAALGPKPLDPNFYAAEALKCLERSLCENVGPLTTRFARIGEAAPEATVQIDKFRLTLSNALGPRTKLVDQKVRTLVAEIARKVDAEVLASYHHSKTVTDLVDGLIAKTPVDSGLYRAPHSVRFTPLVFETEEQGDKIKFRVSTMVEPIRPLLFTGV